MNIYRQRCRKRVRTAGLIGLFAAAATLMAPVVSVAESAVLRADASPVWTSQSGEYTVSYASQLAPIVINQIHKWVIQVESTDGKDASDVEISIDGRMPVHDHGLPTQPRMTENLGHGEYLIDGMRFHMRGQWEILITISADGKRDTVVIPLDL